MSTQPTSPRRSIALKALGVLLVSGVLVTAVQLGFMNQRIGTAELGWALSIALVHGTALGLMLGGLILFRIVSEQRAARTARVAPRIRVAMAGWVSGEQDTEELKRLFRAHPDQTDRCFGDQLLSIKGSSNRRLHGLAQEIGLAKRWKRAYRRGSLEERVLAVRRLGYLSFSSGHAFLLEAMSDAEEDVAVEAARTLAEIGDASAARKVYDFTRTRSQLVLALLAEDLRPHVESLRRSAVLPDLRSGDDDRTAHALDLLAAWAVPLPIPMDHVLEHPNRDFRIRGLRLLTPATPATGLESLLRLNLCDEPEAVIQAASRAAGRLRIRPLIPLLEELLKDSSALVCRAAANALAQMDALERLERKIRTGGSPGAEAALEALEMARLGREVYAEA